MSYKAQLVVRARGKEGVAIVDKVKEMASEEGKTYSEMAVELLGRGLNADASAAADLPADDEGDDDPVDEDDSADSPEDTGDDTSDDDEVAAETEDGESDEDDQAPAALAPPPEEVNDDPNAPLPREEAGPPVDPNLPVEEIVAAYLERRDDRGDRAAARILVDFFAEAEAQEANDLKKQLRTELGEKEFETIMDPVENTPEYRNYIQRVLFEKPSKYSSLSED